MKKQTPSSPERRSFLTGLNSRIAALATVAAGSAAMVQAKPATPFEPARHDKDDWLDELPGKHRLVFDTTTPEGFGEALSFAANFIRANQNDYGLHDGDLAVIIIARHRSTPFAYTDAMWVKYGGPISTQDAVEDPKNKKAPTVNMYNAADYGRSLSNRGTTIESLLKHGVQFAVCSMATGNLAGVIATATGGDANAIKAELIANLIPNARMVPAGIVAVSRAQERGYTFVKA